MIGHRQARASLPAFLRPDLTTPSGEWKPTTRFAKPLGRKQA